MANFEINQSVPPQNEQDAKQVVYHLNENPFGLPFSTRALTSLIVGVVFLAIVAAVATFIIVSSRSNNAKSIPTPTPAPIVTASPTQQPSPTPISNDFLVPSGTATSTPSLKTTITPTPGQSTTSFTSSKYGYSFQYKVGWSTKNFGAVDSLTDEMIGINPTPPVPVDAAILVAVKNTTYDEQVATGTGTTSPTTVNGTAGSKRVWTDGKGITYTKVTIPLNGKALIFVAKSPYETELNALLNSYSQTSTLGVSTGYDGGNPYINEE